MQTDSNIDTILVDFSFTLCFPKTEKSIDSLNGHYAELKKDNSKLYALDSFILNTQLLQVLKEYKNTCSIHIFTSGFMHTDPAFAEYLHPVFDSFITSKELNYPKSFPDVYKIIANKLGTQTNHMLFIDDQHKNVAAAQKAGVSGIQFTNTTEVIQKLHSLLGS